MGKYAFLIATVVGMGLVMLFGSRVGYWIEDKIKERQLRRKKEEQK
jgi:uncharacterized protein YneF (UPF0154 family)